VGREHRDLARCPAANPSSRADGIEWSCAWRICRAQIDALKNAGVKFRNQVESGPFGRQIQVEDPDGNPIELFQPAQ